MVDGDKKLNVEKLQTTLLLPTYIEYFPEIFYIFREAVPCLMILNSYFAINKSTNRYLPTLVSCESRGTHVFKPEN